MNKSVSTLMFAVSSLALSGICWAAHAQDASNESPIWEGAVMDRYLRGVSGTEGGELWTSQSARAPRKS